MNKAAWDDQADSLARSSLRPRAPARRPAVKPDGEVYRNTDEDWLWLSEVAGKAARWLGYIPFERIIDNRNAEPIIHRKARVTGLRRSSRSGSTSPSPTPTTSSHWRSRRDSSQGKPTTSRSSARRQALRMFSTRSRNEKQADLYLPTGEISDTLVYRIAKDADDDGRPLVLFTLADCDPAGRQMAVSIARKLQALRDLLFPDLRFEVVPVALNPEQVAALGLPSTPLKETEKRADRWREAFGVEQTEIDALATLRPDVLREIVERAFDPYVDRDLEQRVTMAKAEWQRARRRSAPGTDRSRAAGGAANRGRRPAGRTEGRDRRYQRAAPNGGGRSLHLAGHRSPPARGQSGRAQASLGRNSGRRRPAP